MPIRTAMPSSLLVAALFTSGCEGPAPSTFTQDTSLAAPARGVSDPQATDPHADHGHGELELGLLKTDFCDDSAYENGEWVEATYNQLRFRYLKGTAAEQDLDQIAVTRLQAQRNIAAFLGVESDSTPITLVLSPNRRAAAHHGYGMGRAYSALNRIEVLYLAEPDSYERTRPGHELSHILGARVDGKTQRLGLLEEGLAEYLDQSGRDHHQAYAWELLGNSGPVARLVNSDIRGHNYGRAGSLVKFLVERDGREKFLQLWRLAAVTYSGSTVVSSLGDKIHDAATLEYALGRMLEQVYGSGFEALRREWQGQVEVHLEAGTGALSAADEGAIRVLLRTLDAALTRGDAKMYRSTLEGFYCESWTDAQKELIAAGSVESRGRVETVPLGIYPVGTRNYPEVIVHALRREQRLDQESVSVVQLWVERFPIGWRIGWATRW